MSLVNKTINGFTWTFIQTFSQSVIRFGIQIFLARLIAPKEFGLFGMMAVFYAIAESLSNSGLNLSLIREENPTKKDFSTVFWTNLFISIFIYFLIFSSSGWIAQFYNQPILQPLIKVYALAIVFNSLYIVQIAIFTRKFDFKTQTKIFIFSLLVSGSIGIYLGFKGFGVYALVYMHVIQSLLNALQYWLFCKWRPSFFFDKTLFKKHFNFGYKIMISSVLNNVFLNIYPMVIGKFQPPSELGFYNRSNSLRNLPINLISTTFTKVTYPILAEVQKNADKFNSTFNTFLNILTLLACFCFGLLFITAKPFILFFLTETWKESIIYLQLLCIGGVFINLQSFYTNLFIVKGLTGLQLRISIISKVLNLIILLITAPLGMLALIIGQVVAELINLVVHQIASSSLSSHSFIKQITNLLQILIPSLIICFVTKLIVENFIENIHSYPLQIILIISLYLPLFFTLHFLGNRPLVMQLYNLVKSKVPKKR